MQFPDSSFNRKISRTIVYMGETGWSISNIDQSLTNKFDSPYSMLLDAFGKSIALTLQGHIKTAGYKVEKIEILLSQVHLPNNRASNAIASAKTNEHIIKTIHFVGELDEQQLKELLRKTLDCPIHRILEKGIIIEFGSSTLATSCADSQQEEF